MDIDRPLDEIADSRKKSRNSNRGRRASAPTGRGSGSASTGARAKYASAVPAQTRQATTPTVLSQMPGASSTAKIIVSNLPDDVSEAQIKARTLTIVRLTLQVLIGLWSILLGALSYDDWTT